MPETEKTIHDDFAHRSETFVGAVHRLEAIGYSIREAQEQVSEWADALSGRNGDERD